MAKEKKKKSRSGHILTHHLKEVCFVMFCFVFLLCFVSAFSRDAPAAYGGPQATGLIGAVAASQHHRHSNARSKPRLQPTPQLMATH